MRWFMNGKDKNHSFSIIIILISIIISFYYFGLSASFLISALFIIFVATKVLQHLEDRNLLSCIGIIGPFIMDLSKKNFLYTFQYNSLISTINTAFSNWKVSYQITKDDIDALFVYSVLSIIVFIFDAKDNTAIGIHSPDGDPEFRNKTFKERNDNFCKILAQRIERINISLNWNDSLYIPIAAEVEMSKGKDIKRYNDMLKCLKDNRSTHPRLYSIVRYLKFNFLGKIRPINNALLYIEQIINRKNVYLVLGDPGSGKSVSLRKLCYDLLKETHITGKTPVYINLKTWSSQNTEWSENNKPNMKDLLQYIKAELYGEGDYFTDDFLNHYFQKMLDDGRWYFIFDSFDEMPCLMDSKKNNELIRHISGLLYEFLTGPNQSGGIIASRMYNRPTDSLRQTYTLNLKKFNDQRIRSMIKKYISFDTSKIVKSLFRDRHDLIGLCRNPFHLALLIEYLKKRNYTLPNNQFDLFKYFIDNRLKTSEPRIVRNELSIENVYDAAIELAVIMQDNSNYGLELPLEKIYEISNDPVIWEKRLSVLEYTKICRFGGNRQTISFVHRRFQEFFYVEAIIKKKVLLKESDYVGILNNTGIRDCLVLYCQIGKESDIQEIIHYCCHTIKSNINSLSNILNEGCVELVNSLYFLTEAFSNRKNVLTSNYNLLSGLRNHLNKDTDFIIQLAIVNSIALLNSEDIELTTLDTFKLRNRWLNSIILSNCQIIRNLNLYTELSFCQYFKEIGYKELFERYHSTNFSLSLTDSFYYVRRVHMYLPVRIIICWFFFVCGAALSIVPAAPIIVSHLLFFIDELFAKGFKSALYSTIAKLTEMNTAITGETVSLSSFKKVLIIILLVGFIIELGLYTFRPLYLFAHMGTNNDKIDACGTKRVGFSKDGKRIIVQAFNESFWKSIIFNYIELSGILFGFFVVIESSSQVQLIIPCILSFFFLITTGYEFLHEIVQPFTKFIKKSSFSELTKLVSNIVKTIKHYILKTISIFFDSPFIISFFIIPIILAGIFSTMLFIIVPNAICHIYGIEPSKENCGVISMLLFSLFSSAVLFITLLVKLIFLIRDSLWLKNQNYDKIERDVFTCNVKSIKTASIRRKYLRRLINNNVKLYGNWPDNRRILLSDDVFNRDLALWDCKENSLDDFFTTGD